MNKRIIACAMTAISMLPAMAQKIETSGDVIDCGQVLFRSPVTAEFEITNKGSRPLVIKDVKTDCGCTIVEFPRNEIKRGTVATVKATFDAKQMGHFQKRIGIYSNDKDKSPVILTMKGVVVREVVDFSGEYPFTLGTLRTDKNDIEFDDVNNGERPQQEIHIMNPTEETVQPVVMHLPGYLTADVSPSKIAPKHSGVIKLTLNSAKLRDFGLTQTSTYLGAKPGEKIGEDKELSISAVLLPDFNKLTETQLLNAPKMKLSASNLELGSFNGKAEKKGVIEITNEGKSTLRIRSMQMFTRGLRISLSNTNIEPGKTAKLKVTAIAEELKTVRSQPRILMITNDPDQAKVIIRINAEK